MRTILLASALCAAAACNAAEDTPPAQAPTTTAMLVPLTPAQPAVPTTAPAAPTSTEASSDKTGYVRTTPSRGSPNDSTWTAAPEVATPSTDVPGRDNTRVNQRDRQGTLTPMDQGSSSDEIRITASIRKSLMADGSLSFMAKNVKVITVGTKVTLRGTVKNADERTTIERRARDAAGVSDVDDQLEVK
jgi:hyperosmotically inducible periplasmic protein